MILLERFVENSDEAKEFLFRVINDALAHEPHPRFRFLFEWIVALCLLRFPGNRDCVWEYLQFPAHQNPKLQVSLLRISLMVARNLPASIREPYFTELAYTVVPLTSNTKVVVRHQSIAMILELWEDADRLGFTTLTENPIFSGVHRGVVTSPYYKEFKGQKDFSTFDPVGNLTFRGIFNGGYLSGGDEVEVIPVDAFHHVSVSAPGRESTLQLGASPSPAPSTSAPIPAPETPPTPDHTGRVEYKKFDLLNLAAGAALPAPIQTKGSSTSPTASTETDIIVCASLLDNAINLGGVSRVSEIMGVKTLTLHARAAVLKSPEFLGVSVHSENWLDIQEVPIAGIAAYLRKMRAEGYAAVGIEQTDRSVILGDEVACRFPKKTLLLLGTEKFGIPAELLGELDWCVEIPQKGRTRSMNVQTAAAVVLYDVVRGAGRAVERV